MPGAGNLGRMTRRFRIQSPGKDADDTAWYWFEVEDDGWVLRQAVFEAALEVPRSCEPLRNADGTTCGGASMAAAQAQLALVRERFGRLGVQLYHTVYGPFTEGAVEVPPEAVDVTDPEFERAWSTAVRHRHLSHYLTGPLPEGSLVTGMVCALPWGPGRTGLFVDINLPVDAFVDHAWLPFDPADWPAVGTVAEFEVVTLRFSSARPQIRLRPTAAPPPGEPWPRRAQR